MHFQPATKCLPLGGCDLEGRNYMLLNAEITMLKKRLIRASQYVNCLTHGGQTVDKVPVDSLRAGKPALLNF